MSIPHGTCDTLSWPQLSERDTPMFATVPRGDHPVYHFHGGGTTTGTIPTCGNGGDVVVGGNTTPSEHPDNAGATARPAQRLADRPPAEAVLAGLAATAACIKFFTT
jgi:hypothetical protein